MINDSIATTPRWTTGMCACAAAKAALTTLLRRQHDDSVTITLPAQNAIEFAVDEWSLSNGIARCGVSAKNDAAASAGDGLKITAEVSIRRKKGIAIESSSGIGIDRTAHAIIRRELENVLDENECHRGVQVTFSSSCGDWAPPVNISFGACKPPAVPAVKSNLTGLLDQAKEYGFNLVAMTQGEVDRFATHRRYSLSCAQVIEIHNYVGYMVRQAALRFNKVLVVGHPGKLFKIHLGCYNTHTQKSVSIVPHLKRRAAEHSWCGQAIVNAMSDAFTAEDVIACIPPEQRLKFFDPLARQIESRLKMYARSPIDVGVMLVNKKAHVVGCGRQARQWEENGCLRLR
jgi:cobalt-precorrin-5B (C1)-methyltransferase